MYRLTCPSCKHVETYPFVRVGALATCTSCGQRFRVEVRMVQRTVPTGTKHVGTPTPAPPIEAESGVKLDDSGQMVGLSDLSDVMRDEPGPEPDIGASDVSLPSAARPRTGGIAGRVARANARRRNARSMYLLLAGLTLVMGLLGFVIYYATVPPAFKTSPQSQPTDMPADLVDVDLPTIPARAVSHSSWQRVDQLYIPADPEGASSNVYIDGQTIRDRYSAWAHTDLNSIIGEAIVEVSLIDLDTNIEVARTETPVMLVGPDKSQLLLIELPDNISDRRLKSEATTRVVESLLAATFLSPITIQTFGEGASATHRITIENGTKRTLSGVMAVVVARDNEQRPLRRWQLRWSEPVEPGEQAEFLTATPIAPGLPVVSWYVEAAGY